MPAELPPHVANEAKSLLAARANLLAHIAKREPEHETHSCSDFVPVTESLRAQVAEVEARLELIAPGHLAAAAK